MTIFNNEVLLEGSRVRLEPLKMEHLDSLCEIGLDPELWTWVPVPRTTPQEMRQFIEEVMSLRSKCLAYAFVIKDKESNQIVGSTRYGNMDFFHRRVEVGWTWIGKKWQRSHINTETKFLMFKFAFEELNCCRVELKTDALNQKSRKAILRIGAKEEGILRKHMITQSGRIRDTVYFSILDTEWPEVKQKLVDLQESP